MKEHSRVEIGRIIGAQTEGVILASAMLFLAAGSLWSHFALGPIFLEPPFLFCWLLVHGGSFLALSLRRFERVIPLAAFVGLQLHFHTALQTYEIPYFPMAPVFFLVGTISLMVYRWGRERGTFLFWVCSWGTTAFWVNLSQKGAPGALKPLFLGAALNFLFVGAFVFMIRRSSKRMRALVADLGPRHSFDERRIHANSLQTLGELAVGLAHEIQNPLAAINGYSYQIQEDLRDPGASTLDLVQKSNERIKFNVDRIIEIAKVMRGFARDGARDEFGLVPVRDLMSDALILMKHNIKAQGIELQVEMPEKDCQVVGHRVQIVQVLVNLLANARDACHESDRKRIDFGYAINGEHVEIWVRDTGPGIGTKIHKDVFKAFFTTKPLGVGTGMGLYIAGMIVDRHEGTISFDCPVDKSGRVLGTRFSLKLKAATAGEHKDEKAA